MCLELNDLLKVIKTLASIIRILGKDTIDSTEISQEA